MKRKKKWSLYILECRDRSYYCGIAVDLDNRLKLHLTGKASRYTRGRLPVKMIYSENNLTHSEALKKEHAIKKLSRSKKQQFISRGKI